MYAAAAGPAPAAPSAGERRELWLRGEALTRQGDHEAALAIWRRLAADTPKDPLLLLRLGVTQGLLGRYDESEATLRRAIKLQPGNAQLVFNLGLMFFRKGELERAEECLKQARALDPRLPGVNEHLAMLWEMRGDHAKANRYYLNEINANNGSLNAWMWALGRKTDRPRREISLKFAAGLAAVCVALSAGLLLLAHRRDRQAGPA